MKIQRRTIGVASGSPEGSFHGRRYSAVLLIAMSCLFLAGQAPAQFVVNWGFTPNTTVPDNGSVGIVNTLGGFASYSNITVSLNLTSQNLNNPMVLGDMYANLTLGSALNETQRTAVLLNRPGRDNTNPFGSSASSLNVTLDDSITQPSGNVWASNGVSGTYNSDGRRNVSPSGPAVAFNPADRNATLAALNGASFASNRFTLLVADYAQGGIATVSNYGYGVTGAAAASGTLDANGGTFSISDTGSGAVNNVGAAVVTTQQGGGPLTVTIAGTMNFNGTVSGTSGLTKSGAGTLTLNSAGTYTGATIISRNGGTLNAAVNNALQSTSSITVNAGGTLLLSGSSSDLNRINNSATMTLNGGTFNTGGLSEHGATNNTPGIGALTLMNNSVIDLSNGASILAFANSSAQTWSGTLSIWNWSGNTGVGGGIDQLYFGSNMSGLTAAQLGQIVFFSDSGVTQDPGMTIILSTGEVVPIPEPGTWAAGILALLAVGYTQRRRISKKTRK